MIHFRPRTPNVIRTKDADVIYRRLGWNSHFRPGEVVACGVGGLRAGVTRGMTGIAGFVARVAAGVAGRRGPNRMIGAGVHDSGHEDDHHNNRDERSHR